MFSDHAWRACRAIYLFFWRLSTETSHAARAFPVHATRSPRSSACPDRARRRMPSAFAQQQDRVSVISTSWFAGARVAWHCASHLQQLCCVRGLLGGASPRSVLGARSQGELHRMAPAVGRSVIQRLAVTAGGLFFVRAQRRAPHRARQVERQKAPGIPDRRWRERTALRVSRASSTTRGLAAAPARVNRPERAALQ